MTKEQKYLKDRFLEPETRCGHYVSAETKACWKVMLDMLEEVDRICRKHQIKYFLIAGSLLGAIRHKGFIPWDDDVDIALFREDYEKLEKVLPHELPLNMFMQTLETDPGYDTNHMKIRNSKTTGIYPGDAARGLCYNMGIFIDVFALEGIPKTRIGRQFLQKVGARWHDFVVGRNRNVFTQKRQKVKKLLYSLVWRLLGDRNVYRLREWTFSRFKSKMGEECVQDPCDWGYSHRYRYPVGDLNNAKDWPFEYLILSVPECYDKILTKTYGDWHKIVKGDSIHSSLEMNPWVGYKKILKEKYGYADSVLATLP